MRHITLAIHMNRRPLLRSFLGLGTVALMASCAEVESPYATAPAPAPPPAGYWNGDGVPGSPKIVVSISEQHAYFYKGKHLVGESTVSTGKPGFGTPPGTYTVVSKDKDHVSTVFGDYVDDLGNVVKSNIDSRKDSKPKGSHYDGARMPYAMFFRGGYAMHQGYVPPYAASHGCIRLPVGMAEPFFDNAPVGTPVIVKQEAERHPIVAPALNPLPTTVSPNAPTYVRSTAPAPVRPAAVRSPAPGPVVYRAPVPVRSPAPVVSYAPAPVRSPAPLRSIVPSPTPVPVRTSTTSVSTRPPVPVRSPSPAPLRSPAPVVSRTSPPLHSPTPAPVRSPSPAPVHSTGPATVHATGPTTVHPAPTPVRYHKRAHSHSPAHSPTPSPTPAR